MIRASLLVGLALFAGCHTSERTNGVPSATPKSETAAAAPMSAPARESGAAPRPAPTHAGCTILPADNPWNQDVSALPVDDALMATAFPKMNLSRGLHPDWGSPADGYGIPITVGKAAAPVPIEWSTDYGREESDKLPCSKGGGDLCYPIPKDAKIEGGGDKHILFLATDGAPNACVLYELFDAKPTAGGFSAASAAIWKLDSNALRPEGWTSADAAGLPILPGLVRKAEVDQGEIRHALRFTMQRTRAAYIHPATHSAGKPDPTLPPMGLRLRLRASFDVRGLRGPAQVIATAMKSYGILLADNGSDWFVSGEMSDGWDVGALNRDLGRIKGSDFEIVKTGEIVAKK